MLVLSRKIKESIIVGDDVEIQIIDIKGDQVKLGINAPRSISIFRKEVFEEIQKENLAAAGNTGISLAGLKDLFKKHDDKKK